jgi:hypothetical protein
MKWKIILLDFLIDLIFLVCLPYIIKILNFTLIEAILGLILYRRFKNF